MSIKKKSEKIEFTYYEKDTDSNGWGICCDKVDGGGVLKIEKNNTSMEVPINFIKDVYEFFVSEGIFDSSDNDIKSIDNPKNNNKRSNLNLTPTVISDNINDSVADSSIFGNKEPVDALSAFSINNLEPGKGLAVENLEILGEDVCLSDNENSLKNVTNKILKKEGEAIASDEDMKKRKVIRSSPEVDPDIQRQREGIKKTGSKGAIRRIDDEV